MQSVWNGISIYGQAKEGEGKLYKRKCVVEK